jgi:hypothetical protein
LRICFKKASGAQDEVGNEAESVAGPLYWCPLGKLSARISSLTDPGHHTSSPSFILFLMLKSLLVYSLDGAFASYLLIFQ